MTLKIDSSKKSIHSENSSESYCDQVKKILQNTGWRFNHLEELKKLERSPLELEDFEKLLKESPASIFRTSIIDFFLEGLDPQERSSFLTLALSVCLKLYGSWDGKFEIYTHDFLKKYSEEIHPKEFISAIIQHGRWHLSTYLPWKDLQREDWEILIHPYIVNFRSSLDRKDFFRYVPLDLLKQKVIPEELIEKCFSLPTEVLNRLLEYGIFPLCEISRMQKELKDKSYFRALLSLCQSSPNPDELPLRLNVALVSGDLQMAESLRNFALSEGLTLKWEDLDGFLHYGNLDHLDWIIESQLIVAEERDVTQSLRILSIIADQKKGSLERLKIVLDKPFISLQGNENLFWSENLSDECFIELIERISWADVPPDRWSSLERDSSSLSTFVDRICRNKREDVFRHLPPFCAEFALNSQKVLGWGQDFERTISVDFLQAFLGLSEGEAEQLAINLSHYEKTREDPGYLVGTLFYMRDHNLKELNEDLIEILEGKASHASTLRWGASLEKYSKDGVTNSICSEILSGIKNPYLEGSGEETFRPILEELDLETLRVLAHSQKVVKYFLNQEVKSFFIKILRDVIPLEDLLVNLPSDWYLEGDFIEALRLNESESLEAELKSLEEGEGIEKSLKKSLRRGRLELAQAFLNRCHAKKPVFALNFFFECLRYRQTGSAQWLITQDLIKLNRSTLATYEKRALVTEGLFESFFQHLLQDPNNHTVVKILADLGVGGRHRASFNWLFNVSPAVRKILFDQGISDVPAYGDTEVEKFKEMLQVFNLCSREDALEILHHAPDTFYHAYFYLFSVNLLREVPTLRLLVLQARLGMTPEQATVLQRRIDEKRQTFREENQDSMELSLYRLLLKNRTSFEDAEHLLNFLDELIQDQTPEEEILEFFRFVFFLFRPELVKSAVQLSELLAIKRQAQTPEETALFFNALQTDATLEETCQAILGSRYFLNQEGEMPEDQEEISHALSFVKVARYQKGKEFARAIYQSRHPLQLEALRALRSLTIPLSQEMIKDLSDELNSSECPHAMKIEILHLLWNHSNRPNDAELKGYIMDYLECGLDLVENMAWTGKELEEIVPRLLEMSHADDRERRQHLALILSRVDHEEALLRATQIVQSSDWEDQDEHFRKEELGHQGYFFLHAKRPIFHENRSSVISRILDRLARLKKAEISTTVHEIMASHAMRGDIRDFGISVKLIPPHTRFITPPIYFPKGSIFRGLKARKGDALLFESIRDLLRHGPSKADLSHMGAKFDIASWCKNGYIFGSHDAGTMNAYNGATADQEGLTIAFDSQYYNEEYMRGHARLEFELGTLNNVLYRGVPWEAIQMVYLPTRFEGDFLALNSDQSLSEIQWETEVFADLSVEELETMRFYLRPVFDKLDFGVDIQQRATKREAVEKKSVKRYVQREEVKKLYPQHFFAMQDDILQDYSDDEFAEAAEQFADIMNPAFQDIEALKALRADILPLETMTRLSMRKIARLALIFRGEDVEKLRQKRPLHGATPWEMKILIGLMLKKSYHELVEEAGYPICSMREYEALLT